MIILKNGRGQLGEALMKELSCIKHIPAEDVYVYHTWDMDSSRNDKRRHKQCYSDFKNFVQFNTRKKVFFISTYSSKNNFYNVFKQMCEAYLLMYGHDGYVIKLPVLTGKGVCTDLQRGTVNPYGDIELMTHESAARQILEIVESVICCQDEPVSRSYRLYGTNIPASLVQTLTRT